MMEDLPIYDGPSWRVPTYHIDGGADLLKATRAQGIEGIISKRLDSIN